MYYKILNLLLFCTVLYGAKIEHIKWHWNYSQALRKAKKQHKPIMLFLQKKDSTDSKKMLFTTLCNQPYIKDINKKYISAVAFFEDKNNYPIELFYTNTFPTVFFINFKDESFYKKPIYGFISPAEFKKILNDSKLK